MCLPVAALVAISAAATVGGTVMSYMGSQQAASAASASANYQAQVARNNATIQEQNAQAATQAGQTQEQNQRLKTAQNLGQARAAMAANGLDTTSGSPLGVIGDTAKLGELDALTIRSNTARTAYNYRVAGMSDTAQAGLDVATAQNAKAAGAYAGASTLLSGATSLSNSFLGWQQAGIVGSKGLGS